MKAPKSELETRRNATPSNGGVEEGGSQTTTTQTNGSMNDAVVETAPLLQHSHSDPSPTYGTGSNSIGSNNAQAIPLLPQPGKLPKRNLISHLIPFPLRTKPTLAGVREDSEEPSDHHSEHAVFPVDDICDTLLENGGTVLQNGNGKRANGKEMMVEHGNESDYLKSKLWCVHLRWDMCLCRY